MYYGMLKRVDMSGCVIENDSIPGFISGRSALYDIKLPKNLKIIGREAFSWQPIKSIELPSTLKRIGDRAFFYSKLESIIIPEGVEFIDDYAFSGCRNVKKIELPSSLKEINESVFWGCGKDVESELKLSEGLEIIGLSSFCDTSIKEVDIPSTVKEIKLAAFGRCPNLQRVKLPENLEIIENEAFDNTNLQEIVWPKKLKVIKGHGFGNLQMNCLELPEGLLRIEQNAFSSSVTEKVILPSTLRELSYLSFSSCTAIKEVYAKSVIPPGLDINSNGTVVPFPKDAVLYVPVGSRDYYLMAFHHGEFKEIIEIETFPTSIDGVISSDMSCRISGDNGMINIVNSRGNSMPYKIYTLDGRLYVGGVSNGQTTMAAAKGAYIVKVGGNTGKVIVR